MAAKKPVAGRKPAITNLARPQGFMDDIVEPVKRAVKQVKETASIRKIEKQAVRDYRAGFEQDYASRALAKARIARQNKTKSKLTGGRMGKSVRGGGSSGSGGGGPRGSDRDNYAQ